MNDGPATSRRILDAGTAEFAAYKMTGARVDRVSANAQADKAQLCAYFGSKDGLFKQVLGELAEAARLFDTRLARDATEEPAHDMVRLHDVSACRWIVGAPWPSAPKRGPSTYLGRSVARSAAALSICRMSGWG
ncbi:TetR/AcrR family transcriptional regulator [Mycobacterium sp. NAZ190054]|uniref:TetR/AcrR family transcriptional regulator n=1 Tax=Mycobacterium sp. NAZ190054 TaxID=1747766 RepID=UPI0009EBC02D|nr:TetR/AcrR family transcriptional regulator [Mycobacterium sp. NAZ190054]